MAPQVGFEPTANRLTADRSTTELLRKKESKKKLYHLKKRKEIYADSVLDLLFEFVFLNVRFPFEEVILILIPSETLPEIIIVDISFSIFL